MNTLTRNTLAAAIFTYFASSASAAGNIYLHLEEIEGESTKYVEYNVGDFSDLQKAQSSMSGRQFNRMLVQEQEKYDDKQDENYYNELPVILCDPDSF